MRGYAINVCTRIKIISIAWARQRIVSGKKVAKAKRG